MRKASDGSCSGRSLEPWIIFRLLSNEFLLPFQEKSWIYDKAPDIGLKTVQSSLTAV